MADRNSTFGNLVKALDDGKLQNAADIPVHAEIYAENERLVPPDSPEGQLFQRNMERITKNLLPDYPLDTQPIHFLITDRGDKNAYVISGHSPTVIAFDKNLLKTFQNEDELAYILGHELTHLKLTQEFGKGANSKSEEYTADIRPLTWMHRAGYDAKAALAFTQREADEPRKRKVDWFDYADVHGLPEHRADAVEKSLAGLDKYVGGLHNKTRALPADLGAAFDTAKHTSYFDRRRVESGYDGLAPLEQLEFINKEAPDLKDGYARRLREIADMVRKIKIDSSQEINAKALNRTISNLMDHPVAFNRLATAVAALKYGDAPFKPAGKLVKISKAMRGMMEAETAQDADRSAKEMIAELEAVKYDQLYLQSVAWPTFELPEKAELRAGFKEKDVFNPPWDDLAVFAQRAKSADIAKALILMGAPDQRALELCPNDFLQKIGDGKIRPITKPVIPDEAYEGLKFSYAGEIIGFDDTSLSNLLSSMAKGTLDVRKKQAEQDARPKLARGTGGELSFIGIKAEDFATNFNDYYDQNRDLLTSPDVFRNPERLRDGDHMDYVAAQRQRVEFESRASALLKMFDDLLTKDAGKYRDLVRGFFLNPHTERGYLDLTGGGVLDFSTNYVRFISTDKHKLFTLAEKGRVLSFAGEPERFSKKDAVTWWRRTLSYEEPKNLTELCAVLDRYNEFGESGESNSNPGKTASYEISHFFTPKERAPGSFSIATFLRDYGDYISEACADTESNAYQKIRKYVEAEKEWPTDAESRIGIYKTLESSRLFPDEQWRARYVNELTETIGSASSVDDKVRLLEQLLLGGAIKDVDLRSQAISMWVDANREIFGKDTGTSAYHKKYDQKFSDLAGRVKAGTNVQQRYEMFSKLADALETQRDWSYSLRDNLIEKSRDQMVKSHAYGVVSEGFLHIIAKEEKLRKGTIEFLINPMTNQSQDKFAEVLRDLEHDEAARHAPKSFFRIEAKRFYENFWNAPMPARVVIIDELLMTAQDRKQDRTEGTENYKKTFEYVLEQVLPGDMKYAREARVFLESYSNVIPAYQRTLLLSSMMVAGERAAYEGKACGVGRRLAMILELMGPAERKVGQAVHSHPQTPEDIRTDMARLKSMAAPPARWDLIARYEEVMPQEYRDTVSRVGSLKGSASYFVTVGLEKKDGTKTVTALQRANAKPQAKEGFRLLHGLIDELRVKDAKLGEVADTLVEMIQQAEKMSDIETDADTGKRQVELAQGLYNGLKVKVGGTTFAFETAPWLAYGAEFRDQAEMKGVHFSDLPEKTAKQKAYKHDVAKAYIAIELANILKGGVFDHDRHGAQLRVDTKTNRIGLFDHGAMELEPPSDKEKQQLAEALFNGIVAYQKGQPIAEVLYDEIHRIRKETGETPDYLVRIERGMLALSDFFRYVKPADVPDILTGIYNHGQIDPVIQGTLMQMVMGGKLDISTFMSAASEAQPLEIISEEVAVPPPPKRYDTEITVSIPDIEHRNGHLNGKHKPANPRIQLPDEESASTWAHNGLKERSVAAQLRPKTFDDIVRRDPRTLQ